MLGFFFPCWYFDLIATCDVCALVLFYYNLLLLVVFMFLQFGLDFFQTHLIPQLGRSGELHDGEVGFEPAAVCSRQTLLHKTAL